MKSESIVKLTSDTTRLWMTTGAIAVGLMITAAAPAAAGHHGERPKVEFSQIDANNDGQITEEEFTTFRTAKRDERFSAGDTNSDGLLSEDEIKEMGGRRAARRASRMIERFDANDDGMLSMDEMPTGEGRGNRDGASREGFMDRFDEDESGTISEAEFEAVKEHMESRRGRHNN